MGEYRRVPTITQISEMSRAIKTKVDNNIAAGLAQYESGEVEPFAGYRAEPFKRRVEVEFRFDRDSRDEIKERLVKPLARRANEHGINAIFAGMGDFAPHIKLLAADFPEGIPSEVIDKKVAYLNSEHSHLGRAMDLVKNRIHSVTFDSLVLAGSSFYICSSDLLRYGAVDPAVYTLQRGRQIIDTIYKQDVAIYPNEHGVARQAVPSLDAPSYYDIVHCSLGRITGLPEQDVAPRLTGFATEVYGTIAADLKRNPIRVGIEDVFIGTAYDNVIQRGYKFSK